jgi:hypothetical protein
MVKSLEFSFAKSIGKRNPWTVVAGSGFARGKIGSRYLTVSLEDINALQKTQPS